MLKEKVAVVIPSYKGSLTLNEKISLTQVRKILRQYDIFFLLPNSLKIDYGCEEIIEKRYSDMYFSSRRMYSRFMLRPRLYRDFENYEYILVYQLDAFVFEDRINDFCNLGYDYIGAPWIDGIFFKKNEKEKMWYVGNGGLSLRKIDAFQRWIEKGEFEPYIDYISEDLLIAVYGTPLLNIAPINIALSFSIEMNCNLCMELTKGKIPFGCHAWAKHDLDFWKPLIEKYGYFIEEKGKKKLNSAEWQKRMNEFCNKQCGSILKKFLPSTYRKNLDGIYIWGSGQWGITLLQKLIENDILVAGFIDNDRNRCGKRVLSYEIFHSSSFIHNKKPVIVAIKNNYFQVEEQLQEWDYQKHVDYITLQDIFKKLEI